MEPVARPVLVRSELVGMSTAETSGQKPAPGLTVSAVCHLSEAGRKASLLAGGDGHAVQRITIDVPANRLHLVTVNGHGSARLKLRPRYELDAEQHVICIDMAPVFDRRRRSTSSFAWQRATINSSARTTRSEPSCATSSPTLSACVAPRLRRHFSPIPRNGR